MPNIKFNYLYRDSANYKNYSSIVFANPENIKLKSIEKLIHSKLIDETYFYADQWQLLELFSIYFDYKIDPTWHEFESVEHTDEFANSLIILAELIDLVTKTKIQF